MSAYESGEQRRGEMRRGGERCREVRGEQWKREESSRRGKCR